MWSAGATSIGFVGVKSPPVDGRAGFETVTGAPGVSSRRLVDDDRRVSQKSEAEAHDFSRG
jgi:hypothetical protein